MNLTLLTGLRRGDLFSLTRNSLTDEALLVQSQKTGKALLFEYTPELVQVLNRAKKLPPQCELIFARFRPFLRTPWVHFLARGVPASVPTVFADSYNLLFYMVPAPKDELVTY